MGTTTITLSNGKTIEVALVIETSFDNMFDVDNDLEDERDKEAVRFGKYGPMMIMVTAMAAGLSGWSCLGACLISKPSDVSMYLEDYDLKQEAIDDLKTRLEEQLITLGVKS